MITQFSAWLTYFGALVFVFLGVYVGVVLAFIAPEELKSGRKYFRGMAHALMGVILGLLLYYYGVETFLCVFLGLALGLALYFLPENMLKRQISYYLMGVVFLLSAKDTDLFIANSAMIFLLGLPLGSRFVEENSKKSWKTVLADVFLVYGAFVVVALLSNLVAMWIARM